LNGGNPNGNPLDSAIDIYRYPGQMRVIVDNYRFLELFFPVVKLGQEKGPDPFLNRKMHWASWKQDKAFFSSLKWQ